MSSPAKCRFCRNTRSDSQPTRSLESRIYSAYAGLSPSALRLGELSVERFRKIDRMVELIDDVATPQRETARPKG
ncbi:MULTISPECIES: hypothetical protein [unclassified Rhizobium]|uniref:hypothetical protein n=1 Tax=unclassified Rhizobium TaxID=2613769 RepID=UPI0007EA3ED5|nr:MULTISPECIES: hypothetical protein [unclassified Rhizobium]ANM11732.1 hypothetical protein AMK05_CH03372 [Rhizobium sp. N324]ANM18207.1 hypothetical protein AMK06_CH03331 [Rhizobium sp. N541]ANM24593.1 hypothetical protein AMK07_CH03329 [Rhizobium sp. N941]OYD05337.1 hypothetical protein AMK08_CH103391 [Rhizobium sp. N4311]